MFSSDTESLLIENIESVFLFTNDLMAFIVPISLANPNIKHINNIPIKTNITLEYLVMIKNIKIYAIAAIQRIQYHK